jgi:hypothetical protein
VGPKFLDIKCGNINGRSYGWRAADEEFISADAPALNVAVTGESSATHLAMHKISEVGLNNPDIPQRLSAEGYLMLKRIYIRNIDR